jgi:hypothetical protein
MNLGGQWRRRMLALAAVLVVAAGAAASEAGAAGSDAGAAGAVEAAAGSEATHERLRTLAPPWYDRERDTWRRLVAPAKTPEPPANPKPTDFEPLLIVAVCVLVAMVVGMLVATFLRSREELAALAPAAAPAPRPVKPIDLSALTFVPAAGAGDPEAALKAALAAGDWRLATIWLYALILVALEEQGLLRLDSGKTDRAYVREAGRSLAAARARPGSGPGAAPDAAAPVAAFEAAVAGFSRVYYGHLAATAASVEELQAARAALARVRR